MLLTVVSFLVALGLLIAIHEYGHYRVAVACGVKVLRFSVGFGKPILTWTPKNQKNGQSTEFVLCLLPLGGYVKMLDEREAPVPPEERHRAFNTQPLKSRAAIVAAGPIANLLLAVLLYACVSWMGVKEPRAILASPVAGSIAAQAGFVGGEKVKAAGLEGEELSPMRSLDDLRWLLTQAALDGQDVALDVGQDSTRILRLPLSRMEVREADAQLFRSIGIGAPWTQALIGELSKDGAGQRSGLMAGDTVLSIAGLAVVDGNQLRERIRAQVLGKEGATALWRVLRRGQTLPIEVTTSASAEQGKDGQVWVGKIGAFVGSPPEFTVVRYGPLDGLWRGAVKTWEISALTLRMMGKMLIGQASLKNLSGPLTIADVAGKSASLGLTQYLVFLALISVSLGVLNLLPLPVLDGGHLMYYLWEAVSGKAVSEAWMERFQRGGVAVLMAMMAVAMFNDVTRIFG